MTLGTMEFVIDDLRGEQIRALLQAHLASALEHSPPESVHALDVDRLRSPDVTFWSAWRDGELLGCCALKQLDANHAEIKSMRTATPHQRTGVGARLLQHLIEQARERGYHRLSLETGSMAAFEPARRLYERFGFDYCPPFGDYREDPYSLFMTRRVDVAEPAA